MYVMVMTIECRLPYINSLKEKRMVRNRLLDRMKRDFKLSACETAHADIHNKLVIGLSAVSGDPAYLQNLPDKIVSFVETNIEGFIISADRDIFPWQ